MTTDVELLKRALKYALEDGMTPTRSTAKGVDGVWRTVRGYRTAGCGCCSSPDDAIPEDIKAVFDEVLKED